MIKLLLQWKDPFIIKKKMNKVDYQVCMKGKIKTFHFNMLKKYIERNAGQGDSDRGNNVIVSSAVIDCTSDEQEDNDDIPSAGNTDGPEGVDVNPNLSNDNHHKVTVLLNEFSDVAMFRRCCSIFN